MPRASPTARRRRLGMELRRLREASGLTIDRVATKLECSDSKISRIETGQVSATPRDVRDMLNLYGASPDQLETLVQVAREARQKGWWQAYDDVRTSSYVGFEAAAASILQYESLLMPGLLQTRDYARAVLQSLRRDLLPEQIERRVELRMLRQLLLRQDDPPTLKVVVDEAALRRPVGGSRIMREQLDHLVKMAEVPTVTLQVLPFTSCGHAGMDGAFTILHFPEAAEPDLVFLETATSERYIESSAEISRYTTAFQYLCADALDVEQSCIYIAKLAKEL